MTADAAVHGYAEAKCDKCGTMVPPRFIAVEVQDGHPIDDPAGFMWCIVCHDRRVVETVRAELARLQPYVRHRDDCVYDECATCDHWDMGQHTTTEACGLCGCANFVPKPCDCGLEPQKLIP